LDYFVDVLQDLLVRDAQDAQALALDERLSNCIFVGAVFVDRSINFDHKRGSLATKVDDEPLDRVLPAKLQPCELATAEPLPQHLLGTSRAPPHLARYGFELLPELPRRRPVHGHNSKSLMPNSPPRLRGGVGGGVTIAHDSSIRRRA
jgi:hypothetical protein